MSQSERYTKCRCKNCGGHIEFPREGAGQTISCPHCNWPTLLAVEKQDEPAAGGGAKTRKRIYQWFAIAATLAIAAGAGFYRYWYMPRLQQVPAPPPVVHVGAAVTNKNTTNAVVKAPPPDPWHGLMAGPVALEKVGDGNLVYAVGKIHNASDHQRFGVKVELDIFDGAKHKVGTATDYTASIDPGKDWHFKALVTDRTAKKARLISVTEN